MKDKIYYKDDSVTLYCADCRDVLPHLPTVDLVLTDPPYGLPQEDFEVVNKAIKMCSKISEMQIYILDWRNPIGIEKNKFAELVWEYGWISGGRIKSNHFYPTHNTIHFCGNNNFKFETRIGSIIKRRPGFSSPRQCSFANKTGHPHEKPKELFKYLMERSSGKPLITILDPFAGSGTTGVAAKALGRKAILIEKEEKYCEIIVKRLAQEYLDL